MPKLEVSGGDSGVRARCGSTAGGAEDLVRVSDVVVEGNAPGISATVNDGITGSSCSC